MMKHKTQKYKKPAAKDNMAPQPAPNADAPERIAKRIVRAGICSRRAAEQLIEDGKVSVNGDVITSPALNVTASDKIMVDNIQFIQSMINDHDDGLL